MLTQGKRFGDPNAKDILIQVTGGQEESFLQREYEQICALSGRNDFCLLTFAVTDWNNDLSPWEAPPAFGDEAFGGGADKIREELTEQVKQIREEYPDAKLYLGGYSLAGLFALWAATKSDDFDGVAAVSPSVWFPGFTDYLKEHFADLYFAYLSLGEKEGKTREAIVKTQEILEEQFVENTLEWNPGNHFKEPDLRMAKGFAWLLDLKDLSVYDQKTVQVTDIDGNVFEGIAEYCSPDYCYTEYGECEGALKIGTFLLYRSTIVNAAELENFTAPFGTLEEMTLESGMDLVGEALDDEEDVHVIRMLRCLAHHLDPKTGNGLPDQKELREPLKSLLKWSKSDEIKGLAQQVLDLLG
jgi:hypothetical protein